MKKRILAGWIALCMCMTAVSTDSLVYAADVKETVTESTEAVGNTEQTEESTERTEDTETTELEENIESVESTEDVEIVEATEEVQETENFETEELQLETDFKGTDITAGMTYGTAAELEFDQDYVAATKSNVAGWYQFTLEKAGLVSFIFTHDKLTGPTENTAAWSVIFNAENSLLNTGMYTISSGAFDVTTSSPQVGLPAGTYRIKITPVSEYASNVAYGLRLSFREAYCETEGNNSASTANELALATEITGSLYSARDTDYYKLNITEDGAVTLKLTHDKVSGKENINLYHVSFLDSAEKTLFDMYSNGAETEKNSVNIGVTKGTYLVKVEGGLVSTADPYTGNYGLTVTASCGGNWEKENNDTTSVANVVVPGVTYGGDIRSTDDVDYFTLTTTGKGYLGVDFSHTVISGWETLNVYKITVSRTGQSGAVYTGYVKGGETSWTMPNLGLPADTYYIKLEAAAVISTSITGGSVETCYPADYNITVNWKNSSAWEEEVNDTVSTANTIKSGITYTGSTATSSDKDYYKINLKKNGYLQVKFEHQNTGNTATHYRIAVLNKDGSSLYEVTNAGVDTHYVSDKIGLAKGTYYLLISVSSTLYTGDYKITATSKAASNWESELNGDTATADTLKVGTEMNGIISSYSGDLDYYKFTLDKAAYVNVSLTHRKINAAGRSWYVYLLSASGKRLNYRSTDHLYSYAGDAYTETDAVRLNKGTYYVVVRAASDNKNAVGEEYAVCVNKISAKAPTVSGVESTAYNKLKVTWKSVPGATSYTIYRSTSKDGGYTEVKTIQGVGTVSWTDSNVTTGKTYYYKMTARVALEGGTTGDSGYSKVKSGKPVPAATTLKGTTPSAKQVKLTWKKVSGADGYEIHRSTKKDGKYSKIKTITKGSVKTYTDKSKLKSGTTYYYKIRAYRKVDGKKVYGEYSKVISKKVK